MVSHFSFTSLVVTLQLLAIPVLYHFIGITDIQLREAYKLIHTPINQTAILSSTPINVPLVPQVPSVFYTDDLETYFGIRLIHTLAEHNKTKSILANHQIQTDPHYRQFMQSEEIPSLTYFIANVLHPKKRLYIRMVSPAKGFGLFSSMPINKRAPIIEYAGLVVRDSKSDYSWWYPSAIWDEKTKAKMDLGLDASGTGNIARFANHDDKPNMEVMVVPYGNRWHYVYVAKRFIAAGEELTVSYGDNYWTEGSRKKE
ncbi:hypothetical protein HK096_007045 [Nowakowskiella sp. JEL0078]|nr:hypothetical protein HK096_007045 [Nowakowskiella sp. JEL0078]